MRVRLGDAEPAASLYRPCLWTGSFYHPCFPVDRLVPSPRRASFLHPCNLPDSPMRARPAETVTRARVFLTFKIFNAACSASNTASETHLIPEQSPKGDVKRYAPGPLQSQRPPSGREPVRGEAALPPVMLRLTPAHRTRPPTGPAAPKPLTRFGSPAYSV